MNILTELHKHPDLIPQEATNFETPLDLLTEFITPVDKFFVRSNGESSAVTIEPETWGLTISGFVERELELTLSDLQSLPQTTYTAFLECSGNGRSRFAGEGPKPVSGTNWGNGAIGNAIWTGTLLRNVLDLAIIEPNGVDVVAQGGDFEGMQRALPLDVALNGDVLVAWEMNGEPLLPVHGGPVRLIVPGWGAIASTKWLTGLEVIDHVFTGYWNADNYVLYDETGAPTGPVTRMPVKSLIVSPLDGAELAPGPNQITGFAWSGYGAIAQVEVSTDGGATWQIAEIVEEAGPHAWVKFAHIWIAAPGPHTLMSRATDGAGNTQPEKATWNSKGYQMNAIQSVGVSAGAEKP
jgi:DMSO/TMAO reductase YedYZ molybdopterin-dependent catalytic subunit